MIKKLKIENGFYETSSKTIQFEQGLNILASKNGSGKSHTLECLNYALFGVQALRSSLKDYPHGFNVELEFEIKDSLYRVKRSASATALTKKSGSKWVSIATGVTPVNLHIKELLTYDYKVFRLTNYCAQDSLLDLTSKSSSELSSLIAAVSGVDRSNRLEDYYRITLTHLKADRRALVATRDNTAVKPYEQNEIYDGFYTVPSRLRKERESLKKEKEDLEIAKGFQRASTAIFKNYSKSRISMENLREYENVNITDLTEVLKVIQESQVKFNTLMKQLRSIKKMDTEYSEEYLVEQEELISLNERYKEYVKLKTQIEKHKIECPNCKHEFYNTTLQLETTFEEAPEAPSLTRTQIAEHRKWNAEKDRAIQLKIELQELKAFLDEHPSVDDVDQQIRNYNSYIKVKEELDKDKEVLKEFLAELRASPIYEGLFSNYIPATFQEDFAEYTAKFIEVTKLLVTTKEESLEKYLLYVADRKAYETVMETLKGLDEKIETTEAQIAKIELLQETLREAKMFIHTQGLPVVNRIASELITAITSEERTSIEISKSFNVLLDNNPIAVAEMSAQALTNVALRFSLLNTFHKDSMLLFIGDEIDSSLHEDRFTYLERCLERLSGLGYQIILVSHKDFSVGNIIDITQIKS